MKLVVLTIIQAYLGLTQFSLQPCSTLKNEIVAGLSTNEVYYWDLKSMFSGSYLEYSLSTDQQYFFIQSPIYQYSNPISLIESVSKITAIGALQESAQRVWLNHFAYVSKQTGVSKLFYSENVQGSYSAPPNFNKALLISTDNSITCLGLEYISKDYFLLDCHSNAQTFLTNTFKIVNKVGTIRSYNNENYNNYQVTTTRTNQVVFLKHSNGTQLQFIFRSTPAYATEKQLDINSIIEVFSLNGTEAPKRVAILTSYDVAILIGYPKPFEYEFSLIDYEVSSTGILYVLTAFEGVLIFQMNEKYDFTYIKQIKPITTQAYEFDVDWILRADGSINEIIAILYSKQVYIYRERVLINQYDLDLVASYPAYISITQEFIITQIKGVTQVFNTETQDAIYKQSIEGLTAFLINPFYTEMIAITQVDSRRYQITNGKLKFLSTIITSSTKKQLLITATDTFGRKCQASLIYKVIDSTDSSVQSLRELSISTLEYDIPPERYFLEPASGPNIQYQNTISTLGTVNIRQGQNIPFVVPADNILYLSMLSLNKDDSNIAIVYQDQFRVVKTQVCKITYSSQSLPMDCRSYSSFQQLVFLNENNFAWFDSTTAFNAIVISANGLLAEFYVVTVKDVTLARYVQYPDLAINKISSVSILANNVYLTQSYKKVIDVWDFKNNITAVATINESLMRSLGMTGNWSPSKTYGNHLHHANLLFIVNEDNVVVVDFHREVTLVKEIYLGQGEISVSVGKTSFIVIYKGSITQSIQEFDLTHLGFITSTKQLPLYLYTLASPLKSVQSLGSGSFYVIAYDKVQLCLASIQKKHKEMLFQHINLEIL